MKFEGQVYELRSIDGLKTARIIEFCQRTYREKWKERFAEDLVQTLARMDHEPGKTVRLVLKSRSNGELRTVPAAAMTAENRKRVREVFNAREERRRQNLEPQELSADVGEFEKILKERWSYYRAGKADFSAAVAALREQCQKPVRRQDFALQLARIIALGIDGHASVSHVELPRGFTPFLIEPCQGRFVAFRPDRSGLLDDEFPFVDQLDGVPLRKWFEPAGRLAPKGSPQFVRRHSLRYLRNIEWLRQQLDLKTGGPLRVRLVSHDGKSSRTIETGVADKRPLYGQWPRSPSRLLDGNIGCLRIQKMSAGSEKEIHRRMKQFRNTQGLIVDLRDNGGGSRALLRSLFSYLISDDDAPRVVNVARYRLHPDRHAEYLQSRFLFPAESPHWSDAERQAIARFTKTFNPRWEPPRSEFSQPHYMVLNRIDHADIYHYDRPVVVLMSEKCFSAVDIFLAGLKGWRNVTLIGTPSGGGSARSKRHKLPYSDIDITVGSMVSWQVNGHLFDGQGVQPDIVVEPDPDYFVGGSDAVLEAALKLLANAE